MFDIDSMPEFRSGNSVPVTRATISRERMREVMEAYADARVREALENMIDIIELRSFWVTPKALAAQLREQIAREVSQEIK